MHIMFEDSYAKALPSNQYGTKKKNVQNASILTILQT